MTLSQIRNISRYTDLFTVALAVFLIPWLSSTLSDVLYPGIQSVDPDETFLYKCIHHVFQLVLTIMAMLLFSKKWDLGQWGFNFNNSKISLQWISLFLIIWSIIQYLGISQNPFQLDYPFTTKNKLGVQFFQYFLSGTGEEPLFRGFVMVYLATHWSKVYKLANIQIPLTLIFATLFFMLAHVQIDVFNFSVTGIDFGQQMNSLQLGILYGLAFHYTKSLLAPIVMHGISNGIIYTILYYFVN